MVGLLTAMAFPAALEGVEGIVADREVEVADLRRSAVPMMLVLQSAMMIWRWTGHTTRWRGLRISMR